MKDIVMFSASLCRYYEATGRGDRVEEIATFVEEWLLKHYGAGLNDMEIDDTTPVNQWSN